MMILLASFNNLTPPSISFMMDLTFEAKCMPFLFQAINIIKAPNCECEIINTGHSKGGLCTRFRILTRVSVGSIVCISQYRKLYICN